jgi:glyoxylase-like metal-dependent hydrolase (beta-lactamase superfamily II)
MSRPTTTSVVASAAVEVTRFADGLWRWTAYYGEWRDTVGCVYYEAPDAIVLIDPLVPEGASEATRFWKALDQDVARVTLPVHVYVTVFWHVRSAGVIVERYDGTLHAPSRARAASEKRAGVPAAVFRPGDALPGGVEALATGRSTEVVYWIPEHRALVPGDVLLGAEGGGLRLCPPSWLPASVTHAKLRAALRPMLDLPVERVLVSHGEPATIDTQARLAKALAGE